MTKLTLKRVLDSPETTAKHKLFASCSKIVPLLMLLFVFVATNEAMANPWPQNLPSPPANVFNVRWWPTGGYLNIGDNDGGNQSPGSQTSFHTINFGAGTAGQNYGRWQIGHELQGFRIGRAWNNTLPNGLNVHNGGIDLLTLNYNGVVGINLTNPWIADQYHWVDSTLVAANVRFRVNGSTVTTANYNTSDRRYKKGIRYRTYQQLTKPFQVKLCSV